MLLSDLGAGRPAEGCVRFTGHPMHRHDQPQFIYLALGHATLAVGSERIALSEGSGAWLPAKADHALSLERGGLALGPMLTAACEPPAARPRVVATTAIHRLMTTLLGVRPRSSEHVSAFRGELERALRAATEHYFTLHLPTHPAARAIANELQELPDPAANLRELAKRHYLSIRHVQRLFLEQTGLPFTTWRRRSRLNAAIACLRGGGDLTAAMEVSGFTTREGIVKALRREVPEPLDQVLAPPLPSDPFRIS